MSEKFRLHLAALLRKNALLKRRHPCSLCCELLLAVGATGLLVMARFLTSNIKSFEVPSQVHVDQTMPVRLPDCAEYLAECSARLVEGEGHNPICVKGVTFGCKAPRDTSGRGKAVPGVWVSMGCNGTFDLGPDLPRIKCASGRMGKPKVCHAYGPPRVCRFDEEHTRTACGYAGILQGECEGRGCCWARPGRPGTPSCFQRVPERDVPRRLKALDSGAMLALAGMGMPGMRRLAAEFGIAPRGGGGEAFRDWLVASGHPWASQVRLFDTAEDLQAHVSSKTYPERDLPANKSSLLCGAVIFETPPESEEVRYALRFNASLGYDPNVPAIARMMSATKIQTDNLVDKSKGKVPGQFNPAGITWYTQSGFLSIQRTVDSFLEDFAKHGPTRNGSGFSDVGGLLGAAARASSSFLGEDGRPHIVVPFPTASWKRDIFALLMPHLLASFLLISLAYSVSRMITAVVHEREARLRDGMRMMGMHTAAFYFSWILTYMAIYTFVALGVVLCLTLGKILPHSSTSLLFLWLMLFAAASISYALVITTFFSKAKTAATVGSVAFYSSSYLVHLAQASSSPGFLRLLSLVPPVCFELAARVFADMESQGVGIKWSNADLTSEHFSVLDGCCMLAVDAVVLLAVFLYLDQVVPREVGLQRPWYFPLQPSFWRELCSSPAKLASVQASATAKAAAEPEVPERSALVEQDVGEAPAMMARSGQTVELRGLTKFFGDLQAVRKLDLVMYQGEIFALLGHNGAGKTTTLAMLCGLMPPTSGSCIVFGHDLAEEPQEVQRLLGVCPQHDVLWEELSCEEHLSLFARFKGVPSEDIAREVAAMLQRVGLQSAGASARFAGKLSGGMKRKLSLGIAFLGGSRLVVLDEPTSGLDPYSRRMVWELLRAMKQGRVTVLSTHYMDEADILGDRIAILHEGRLMCCGSPQFLKRAYDCGYNVTFVKRPGCETDAVMEAVCRHMPELASEVATLSDSGNELILQFPFAAARHFPQVLGGLEREMTELHVESYGVSVTTLEEVFLKVASGESVERKELVADSGGESDRGTEYIELQELPSMAAQQAREVRARSPSRCGMGLHRVGKASPGGLAAGDGQPTGLSGMRLAALQLRALLQKRWRYGLRDRRGLLCQLFLPSFTLLLLLMLMSAKLFYSMPPLELQADHYNEHCTSGPQNVVDFTHLASVDPKEAEAMLAPGKPFWRGDLRRQEPEPESEKDLLEETLITSRVPGFMQNVLRPAIQKVAAAKKRGERNGTQAEAIKEAIPELLKDLARPFLEKGRRLARKKLFEESLLERAEARFLALAHGLWVQAVQARHAAGEALDAASPLQGPDLAAVARRLADDHGPGPLFPFGRGTRPPLPQARETPEANGYRVPRLDPGCVDASLLEKVFWESADMDHNGLLSKDEARGAIRQWIRRADAAKHHRADDQAPVKGEDKLDALLEEALFLVLDRDHDGVVDMGEYCRVGALIRHEIGRWYNFATHFSTQILNTPSACTRYGAYFVLSPARAANSPEWTAGADAAIFVNTSSSHAAPVFQAALTNARLARLGLRKRVALKAHPFPQTQDEQHNLEKVAVFLLAIYITFCLSFIPSGIAHFVVKERQTGARQLQVLSGASTLSYWLANLTYDVALYVAPALCVPLALRQFGFEMILAGDCGKALAVVLAAFGPAVAGFSYLVAFVFKDHSKASNAILSFCLVGASVLSTILFILAIINYNPMSEYPSACDHPTKDYPEGTCVSPMARLADRILGPLFRLVPTVCVYQALFSIALMANLQAVIPQGAMEAIMAAAGDSAPRVSLSPFAYEWAGEPLCYLCVEAVGYFGLAVLLDLAMHSPRVAKLLDPACLVSRLSSSSGSARSAAVRGWRGAAEVGPPLIEAGAADASARLGDGSAEVERERAGHLSPQDVSLHVWELEKTYQPWLSLVLPQRRSSTSSSKPSTAPKRAVRGVSLAVHSGEVFGLLGHNGAGKTSALKCLVGELCCTTGRVYVGGYDMEKDAGKARRRIGYCPQFDALLELLTVQDHLDLFAALKGLPRESAARAKHDFNLEKIVHRRAELLSGGNKRKLSAAIALIGGPCLAVLDEPSCGLDPAARRALWTAVHCAVAGASSAASAVLLTTHSMEEAEALSSRLGIMAEGQLLTVGTAQQIKQRHGGSHELCFTLRPESEGVLASTLQHLGNGALAPETPLDFRSVGPLLEQDAGKKQAYARQRCVVRAQIEATGHVEASVLAEWWLQQTRGEAIDRFLKNLLGDGVELAENFGAYWRFCLPHGGLGLPEMFRQLEEGGKELGIGEYTLTQATLEQIFNGIAHEAQDSQEGA